MSAEELLAFLLGFMGGSIFIIIIAVGIFKKIISISAKNDNDNND